MALQTISILAEDALLASLREEFSRHGVYQILEATAAAPLPALASDWPQALIICADGESAATIARGVRNRGFPGPIALLTAPPLAICADADVILSRPLRFADLLAALEMEPLRIGRWRLHGHNLIADHANLRLTEKEAAILRRLALSCGESVSREKLLRDVWGYSPNVSSRTLETHIYRLRQKMAQNKRTPRRLMTTEDGYRLILGAVEELAEDSASSTLT